MPKKLLLADDSVTIQKVVGITFANEDVELITVDNGDDALTRARAEKPDLVLADVGMPGLNGYELSAALRAEPELAHVPVLLLTGTFETYDEEKAQEVGASDHIAKPFEAQALVDQVHRLLSRSAAAPPADAPAPAPAAQSADALPLPDPSVEDEWEPPSSPRLEPLSDESLQQLPNTDFEELGDLPVPAAKPAGDAVLPPAAPPPAGPNSAADPFHALEFADPTPEPNPNSGIFGENGFSGSSETGADTATEATARTPEPPAPTAATPETGERDGEQTLPPAEPPAFDFDATPPAATPAVAADAPTRPRRPGPPEVEAPSLPRAEAPPSFDLPASPGDEDNNVTAFLDPLAAAPAPRRDPEPPEIPSAPGDGWSRPPTRAEDLPEVPAATLAGAEEDFAGAATVVAADPLSFAAQPEPAAPAPGEIDPLTAAMPSSPSELPEFAAPPAADRAPAEVEPEPEAIEAEPIPEPEPVAMPQALPSAGDDTNATTAPSVPRKDDTPRPVAASTETASRGTATGNSGLDSETLHQSIEKVAFEAFGSLSEELVREFTAKVEAVVWEVVPPLAERLIREELQRLRGDDPS